MEITEDSDSVDIPELDVAYVFREQPMAVPADLRPTWRIGLLVLLLKHCCKGGRTSFTRLHALSWGMLTATNRQQLLATLNGRMSPDSLIIRFEPFLNQAVEFAAGEKLVENSSGDHIQLTALGRQFADEIDATPDAFVTEREFISQIRLKLTETLVQRMFGWKHKI